MPLCPTCNTNELKLYQIDLNVAVYLCSNRNCTYPKGHNCTFVERSFEHITNNPNTEEELINLDEFISDTLKDILPDNYVDETTR